MPSLSTTELRELFGAYHRGARAASDEELDEALGLVEHEQVIGTSYEPLLEAHHAAESIVYLPTPYPACRSFFHEVAPTSRDLVFDLGCGVGRLVLYGALTTQASFRGVEIVEPRYAAAKQAAARLLPCPIEIVHGNALEQDLETGTIFYAYRPFSPQTESTMLARFHAMAKQRPVTVGTYRLPPTLFDPQIFHRTDRGALQIYRSHPAWRSA